MPSLILRNNLAFNPLEVDVSQFLDLTTGSDIDPQNPAFSNKVISHSLLKEGGVLALEDLQAKELVFPLKLNAASESALIELITQINQVITTPGASYSWQDDALSEPTVFDAISGQFDIKYSYRETSSPAHWCTGDLRLFCQPLGHASGPRPYAVASGPGPLLLISPYEAGRPILSVASQAGTTGFAGVQQPGGGIFYTGQPSLAGDGAAQLQVSFVGPGASAQSLVAAVALLPDPNYQALWTVPQMTSSGLTAHAQPGAVASQYLTAFASGGHVAFPAVPSPGAGPTPLWAGNHRILGIARASQATGFLYRGADALTPYPAVASVTESTWDIYDLGTISLRANEYPSQRVVVNASTNGYLDLTAVVMLPDDAWFLGAGQGQPNGSMLLLDDVLDDQFLNSGVFSSAPSPIGLSASSTRVTQYTRGRLPRPDPGNGLPILALLALAPGPSSSAQGQLMMAQVNVLERTRYVLP